MWSDNETNRDFLNFKMVADTAAEVIIQAKGRPLSLGISGSWGVGKSSLIKLVEESLKKQSEKFLFVDFNAWLYQGYDDARAALMDVIARELLKHAEQKRTGLDKAKELLKRIDWLRVTRLTVSGIAAVHGIPPVGDIVGLIQRVKEHSFSELGGPKATELEEKVVEGSKSILKPKVAPDTPPKEIQDLRNHFESTLKELGITLVVLVDDLDRCLPATAISTLEAIRLFLFLENTAFVIAADDKMIRQYVRAHFADLSIDSDLVTNYFDKLIQVPIRVPPLGTQDVRAYMMLLYIENSSLEQKVKDDLREKVCKQLSETWLGKRVDRAFVMSLINDCPQELRVRLDTADRLAPLMASSKQIAGNPRLIKRFLNTLSIRQSIAKAQSVSIDETALSKMLLFERCGGDSAYAAMVAAINADVEGKPRFLKKFEEAFASGRSIEDLPTDWNSEFATAWLALPPKLADLDLRGIVHVSREHLPLITAADQMTPEAAELMVALLSMKKSNHTFKDRIAKLIRRDSDLILERLLMEGKKVEEWAQPPILHAYMAMAEAIPEYGVRISAFLFEVPKKLLKPAIVPNLQGVTWAKTLLESWADSSDTPSTVKNAIKSSKRGIK